jgi:peptidyl-prolyl cis-trans isomerase C
MPSARRRRTGLALATIGSVGLGLGLAAVAPAQTPAQTPAPAPARAPQRPAATAAPAAKAAAPAPAANPNAKQVLATVNGEPIYRPEVETLLGQFSIPAGSEPKAYSSAMDLLINTKVLAQFLRGQRIAVKPEDVAAVVAEYESAAKGQGSSLATELSNTNTTMEAFQERITRSLQWKNFVIGRATDAELKKYAETNREFLNGTQVRASHILVEVPEGADAKAKAAARQKLLAIKKEIEGGKLTFADAANRHSEDPGNKQTPSGGDLDFFPRKGRFIEPFSAKAFAMKKGEISEPVETEFGLHLIQVTDRREGQPVEFEKAKSAILEQYAAELQEQIVQAERAKAKIQITPLPAGLIKPEPAPEAPSVLAPAGAAPATKPAAPATKPAAPATKPAAPAPARAATPKS